MVSAIFTQLTSIATSFVTLLVNLFQNVVSLFWTEGVGDDPGELTVVGTFMLIGIATGLVIWAFHFIKNMVRIRTKN